MRARTDASMRAIYTAQATEENCLTAQYTGTCTVLLRAQCMGYGAGYGCNVGAGMGVAWPCRGIIILLSGY